MKIERVKNLLIKTVLPVSVGVTSLAATPVETQSLLENLSDFDKAGITFLVSAEILGTALLGLRFADGARNKVEKYGWQVIVPVANGAGMAFLLVNMWL